MLLTKIQKLSLLQKLLLRKKKMTEAVSQALPSISKTLKGYKQLSKSMFQQIIQIITYDLFVDSKLQQIEQMKKIVFVEKQDNSTYDPVSTFFANRKSNSSSKPPLKPASKPPQTNIVNQIPQKIKNPIPAGKKQTKTIKSDSIKTLEKQQTVYQFKQEEKKQTLQNNLNDKQEEITFGQKNKYLDQKNDQFKQKYQRQGLKQGKKQQNELIEANRKLKDCENIIKEYERQMRELQEKIQKLTKSEQKLIKFQKQNKISSNENKELNEKLRQKQNQIKFLLQKSQIKYSKKRQLLINNQIRNLKKCNRELVGRIKNYKGSDLIQMSALRNKSQILNDFNEQSKPKQQEIAHKDFSEIQSLVFRLLSHLQSYLSDKTSSKMYDWVTEQKILLQIMNIGQNISIECLNRQVEIDLKRVEYQSMYNMIQKHRIKLNPLIDKLDLSFAISQQNIGLINQIQQNISLQIQLRESEEESLKIVPKFKKIAEAVKYYQDERVRFVRQFTRYSSYQVNLLAHSITQQIFIKQWVEKNLKIINDELTKINNKLNQLHSIYQAGDSHFKESILFFVSNNIQSLSIKVPQLKLNINNIKGLLKELQSIKYK